MTFKEARAQARERHGAYIGVYEQEERGWFVQDTAKTYGRYYGVHPRAVFWVRNGGSLVLVNSTFAKNYQKKYFGNLEKKLDKWRDMWYN